MTHRRITLADLVFGEPLRWDLFGPGEQTGGAGQHQPLLQKGQMLAPSSQLNRWIEAGLFAKAAASGAPTVLRSLNELNRALEILLLGLRNNPTAHIELAQLANELIETVERSPDIALAAIFLNQIAGLYAVRHCVESAVVATVVARAMRKTQGELHSLVGAALTMNVGMLKHADNFQIKNSVLTCEERKVVHQHPIDSVELLRSAGVEDAEWLSCVMMHHENENGAGYPDGRRGDEIPQNAKLISLADRYCAFVSARNYRRSLLPDLALHNLFVACETPVDLSLAAHFISQLGAYPPGCLVRLENGETGVVTHRQPHDRLDVVVLRDTDGQLLPAPLARRTEQANCAITQALHEDEAGLRFNMKQIWGELAAL